MNQSVSVIQIKGMRHFCSSFVILLLDPVTTWWSYIAKVRIVRWKSLDMNIPNQKT